MRQNPLLLLVDDDEDFCEIMTTQLTAAGFEVTAAHKAQEAIIKAKELMPDLILMDINLADTMTGIDVALNLKQDPQTQHIRIAFLSSAKDPWPGIVGERKDVSRELGMEDYFDKTDDLPVLTEKIKKFFQSVGSFATSSAPASPPKVAQTSSGPDGAPAAAAAPPLPPSSK